MKAKVFVYDDEKGECVFYEPFRMVHGYAVYLDEEKYLPLSVPAGQLKGHDLNAEYVDRQLVFTVKKGFLTGEVLFSEIKSF